MSKQQSGYPPYVKTLGYGAQSTEIPGDILGARTCAFALDIEDPARLQATCDHFLSDPTDGAVKYKVLGKTIFMTFMHAQKLTSGSQAIGWVPDHEAAFWVPLIAKGPHSKGARLVFWMPFINISVPEGMVTGREVWGFRKQVGETVVADFAAHPMTFSTSANVYDPMDRNTEGRIEPLATVTGPGEQGGLSAIWSDIESAIRGFADLWTEGSGVLQTHDLGLVWNILQDALKAEVEIVNLKQFRDAHDSTRACYQALIEGPCRVHKIRGGGLLPDGFKATIPNWQSHQIPHHLGLPLTGELPVRFGVWVDMDFSADAGREIWKANQVVHRNWFQKLFGLGR